MGNFRVIAKEVKEDAIRRIKEEGKSVKEVAEQVGVDRRTVYGWLSKGIAKETNIIEINRLKRENQFLVSLVGRLTMEKEQSRQRGKK